MWKNFFLTNLVLNTINEFENIFLFFPISTSRYINRKLIKCFTNNIPKNIISNILDDEVLGLMIDELCGDKEFEKSETEREASESLEEIECPQGFDSNFLIVILLDNLNENKKKRSSDSSNG